MGHDGGIGWGSIARSPLLRVSDLGDALGRTRGKMVYLATPYSNMVRTLDGAFCPIRSDGMGMRASFWVAMFAANGVTAVSPVSCAVAALGGDTQDALDPLDAAFWEGWCRPLLRASAAVVIPQIEGWNESAGVFHEARVALDQMKPVYLIRPDEGGVF